MKGKQKLLLEPIEGKQRLLFAVAVGIMRRELCVEVEHPPPLLTEWPCPGGPQDPERTEF